MPGAIPHRPVELRRGSSYRVLELHGRGLVELEERCGMMQTTSIDAREEKVVSFRGDQAARDFSRFLARQESEFCGNRS